MWAKCLGTACKYCAVVFACVGGSVTAAEIAQTVFTNGHIYTGDQNAAWATTMVVHKKKIVYVGLEDPPTDLLSAKTTSCPPVEVSTDEDSFPGRRSRTMTTSVHQLVLTGKDYSPQTILRSVQAAS